MKILIKNSPGLIGDFLGFVPALQRVSLHNQVYLEKTEVLQKFYNLIKKDIYNFYYYENQEIDKIIFANTDEVSANNKNKYMSGEYLNFIFNQFNIDIHEHAPKIDFNFLLTDTPEKFDYLIAPYGRSAPIEQKISLDIWKKFFNKKNNFIFGVLGDSRNDNFDIFNNMQNVIKVFDNDFNSVYNKMKNSKGVISIVTGITHFCYHAKIPNILFSNQFANWGNNPEARTIIKNIPNISVNDIEEALW
jgi:hypothetical protein